MLIDGVSIPLFNPSIGYINYALAAVLILILHQTMIAGAGILGAYQNQQNALGMSGYWNNASPLQLIFGRICAFSCIYIVLFLFYFGFLFQMYDIHVHANILSFWCFSLMLIICCASFGVLFGLLLKDPAKPTQIILVSSLPLVFMSGFIWPLSAIPTLLVGFMHFIPAFHGINALVKMNQMGADLSLVMNHFYWLCFLCLSTLLLSWWILTKRQHKSSQFKFESFLSDLK